LCKSPWKPSTDSTSVFTVSEKIMTWIFLFIISPVEEVDIRIPGDVLAVFGGFFPFIFAALGLYGLVKVILSKCDRI